MEGTPIEYYKHNSLVKRSNCNLERNKTLYIANFSILHNHKKSKNMDRGKTSFDVLEEHRKRVNLHSYLGYRNRQAKRYEWLVHILEVMIKHKHSMFVAHTC